MHLNNIPNWTVYVRDFYFITFEKIENVWKPKCSEYFSIQVTCCLCQKGV